LLSMRSFTANGLCVLIAAQSDAEIPARSSATFAAGTTAIGMCAFSTRASPNEMTCVTGPPSFDNCAARSLVVTIMPALPSAGYVCVPNVTVPSGITGRSRARPSFVVGKMPSSASIEIVFLRPLGISSAYMYFFWNARSSARAAWYCSLRMIITSSCSSRVKPNFFATFSAVASIASFVFGSALKLSQTHSSVLPRPPTPFGLG